MEVFAMENVAFVCAWLNCKAEDVLSAHATVEGGFAAVLDQGIAGAPKFVLTPDEYREALEKYQAGRLSALAPSVTTADGALQAKPQGKLPGKARKGK